MLQGHRILEFTVRRLWKRKKEHVALKELAEKLFLLWKYTYMSTWVCFSSAIHIEMFCTWSYTVNETLFKWPTAIQNLIFIPFATKISRITYQRHDRLRYSLTSNAMLVTETKNSCDQSSTKRLNVLLVLANVNKK